MSSSAAARSIACETSVPPRARNARRDHRSDALPAGVDHIAGDVMEEGLLGNDALPDLRLDEGHLLGYPKIQGGRHQGGPNLSYRPDLYNRFRGMVSRLPRAARTLQRNRCAALDWTTQPSMSAGRF